MSESYGPYRAHEVAEWFPLLGDAELRELAESIKREGQIEACVVWGSVLVDGRNRWRACELAGVEARIVRREFESEAACGRWIIATNLHRRHLTTTQRAMLAARQLPWFEAQARGGGTKRPVAQDLARAVSAPATVDARGCCAASLCWSTSAQKASQNWTTRWLRMR